MIKRKILAVFVQFSFFLNCVFVPPESQAEQNASDISRLRIPRNMGKLAKLSSQENDCPDIILVEDIHAHAEAQKNIERILSLISATRKEPLSIYLEGGSRPIDLSPVRLFPSSDAVHAVTNAYLEEGRLSADEYFAIRSAQAPLLEGVENQALYEENVAAFKALKQKEPELRRKIDALENHLRKISPALLNAALREMVEKENLYAKNELAINVFADFLIQKAAEKQILLNAFPNVLRLQQSSRLEKTISLENIQSVIEKCIQTLSQSASKEEMLALIKSGLQARLTQTYHSSSIEELIGMGSKYSVSEEALQNLAVYAEYLKTNEEIRTEKLFEEMDHLSDTVRTAFCLTREENSFLKLLSQFNILKNMVFLKASPKDFARYALEKTKDADWLKNLSKNICKAGVSEDNSLLCESLTDEEIIPAINYYETAFRRNQILSENTMRSLKESGKPAVLILGGFHTQAVSELLMKEDKKTWVITPSFQSNYDSGIYEKLLSENSVSSGPVPWLNTLRQRPVTERETDFYQLQFDILLKAIQDFDNLESVKDFLEKAIRQARERTTRSIELLDELNIVEIRPHYLLLESAGYLLVITPSNLLFPLKPAQILSETDTGFWSVRALQKAPEVLNALKTASFSERKMPFELEGHQLPSGAKEFLARSPFLKRKLENLKGQIPRLKIELEADIREKKKVYKIQILSQDGESPEAFALKIYDTTFFHSNKEEIQAGWEKWKQLGAEDTEGKLIAKILDDSPQTGMILQEWVDGATASYSPSTLKEIVGRLVEYYLQSEQKLLPGDFDHSNMVAGKFVDEEEILDYPSPFELLSKFFMLPFTLGQSPDDVNLTEAHEAVLQTVLAVFEKEKSLKAGLQFLQEAYDEQFVAKKRESFSREEIFSRILLSYYLRQAPEAITPPRPIEEIESALQGVVQSGPDTDYRRELLDKRSLEPGQTVLHLGTFPAPALALAECLKGLRVWGVDSDQTMVNSANRRVQEIRAQNAISEPPRFFTYAAESLDEEHGFPENSVNHVHMAELFEGRHPPQPGKIIQNVVRLLKEGGTVVLSDAPAGKSPGAPTTLELLQNFSEESPEWALEWDIQPLSFQNPSGQQIYLATLKKKEKKTFWIQLERFFASLWYALERYSNVHRGMGQHSQISTHLFDKARDYIGEGLGINFPAQQVILGGSTARMLKALAHDLRLSPLDTVISDNAGNWDHIQSAALPVTAEGALDWKELETFLERYHPKIIAIENPVQYGLHPENIQSLSELVHRYQAKLVVDASEWDIEKINAKEQGIDYLLFEGGRLSPFAPAILVADLEWMKTGEKEAPFEPGGGTKKLIRPGNVVWAGAPDKFEVGSPNIPGTILLGSLFKNKGDFPSNQTPFLHKSMGDATFEKLRSWLVGKNVRVPTRNGEKEYINFDNAASTPTFVPVLKALFDYLSSDENTQRILLSRAVQGLLNYFGAPAQDYDLFSFRNTSESINYLAHELEFDEGSVVVNSLIEHNSNELPWRKQNNIRLPIDDHGFMDLDALEQLLAEYNEAGAHSGQRIQLVAISGASNVLGTVNDLAKISRIVHQYGAQLLVDAAQLSAHRAIDMEALGIDFLVYAGHKMYAPFGHGGLIARKGLLKPPPGEIPTSPEGMIALAKMAAMLQEIGLKEVAHHEEELLKHALQKFQELEKIPGVKVKIHGISDPESPRLKNKTGVISFNLQISDELLPDSLKGRDYLPFNLVAAVLAEEGGIGVRTGCFCADLLLQRLLGMSDAEAAVLEERMKAGDRSNIPGTTRMSFGIYNTPEEIDRLFDILTRLAQGKYDLSKYQLNPASGEYYTPEHLAQMDAFSQRIEEKVFGTEGRHETTFESADDQDFFRDIRSAFEKHFGQSASWDEYFASLGQNELNYELRKLREKYAYTKTKLSGLPFLFALWLLKDMPPSSGKQHIVIMQRGADSLGVILKQTAQALGWTHIEFHDFYFNDKISGFNLDDLAAQRFDEEALDGNNTQDEIFQYAMEQGFLDGSPVTFMDTGFAGSYPTFMRKLLKNRALWKKRDMPFRDIPITSKLFFFEPPMQVQKRSIIRIHSGQIEGFNDVYPLDEASEFWDEITRFLDKGFRHAYERPSRLISKETPDGNKLEPELIPEPILTQITYAAQVRAAEDMVREKIAKNNDLFALLSLPEDLGNIPDSRTFIFSDKSIDGVATQKMPLNKKIAVFENSRGDAKAYAGNFLQVLRKNNSVRPFSLENANAEEIRDFLTKFQPDFILLPQDRTDIADALQEYANDTGRTIPTLAYVSLDAQPFQNLFYSFSARIAGIVKKAIQAHQSQVSRTPYDEIFYSSSLAAGEKASLHDAANTKQDEPHAQAFRIGFIQDGVLSTTSNLDRYSLESAPRAQTLTLDNHIPMLIVSPHSDDLEIAAGGLVRSRLETGEPGQTVAYNWIIGTGDEWGVQFEPDDPRSRLPEEEQDALKREIRRKEALEASAVLSDNAPGKLDVELFGLPSAAQHPLKGNAVLPLTDARVTQDITFLESKLEKIYADFKSSFDEKTPFNVVLPHPEDEHPHHQMATKIMLEALKGFSEKHGIQIQLLFYSSPWAGRFNTYYVSERNAGSADRGMSAKVSIAAKVKRGLGIILGELFAGFGQKPLSEKTLGGKFAERFMRKTFSPSGKNILAPPVSQKLASPVDTRHAFEAAA